MVIHIVSTKSTTAIDLLPSNFVIKKLVTGTIMVTDLSINGDLLY